jgi:hypothetical protein
MTMKSIGSISLLLLAACQIAYPEWLMQSQHSISPDGKAALYIHSGDSTRVSIASWFTTSIGDGGAGVFDLYTDSMESIELIWHSDSLAEIKYPSLSTIIRKESRVFFGGRNLHLIYSPAGRKIN